MLLGMFKCLDTKHSISDLCNLQPGTSNVHVHKILLYYSFLILFFFIDNLPLEILCIINRCMPIIHSFDQFPLIIYS